MAHKTPRLGPREKGIAVRTLPVWLQWTVVFTVLGIGGWVVYPALDPFEPIANKPGLMGIRQEIFGPTTRKGLERPRAIEFNGNITGTAMSSDNSVSVTIIGVAAPAANGNVLNGT